MKGGTQGFPRHKVSDKQEVLFEDVSPSTAFSIRQLDSSSWWIENAVDGETSSNKTSCLSLTSCLGNPCVPPFIISKCEWALKSLSPSWNTSTRQTLASDRRDKWELTERPALPSRVIQENFFVSGVEDRLTLSRRRLTWTGPRPTGNRPNKGNRVRVNGWENAAVLNVVPLFNCAKHENTLPSS